MRRRNSIGAWPLAAIVVLTMGVVVGGASAAPKKAVLKPAFERGQAYRYQSTTEVIMRLPGEKGDAVSQKITLTHRARLEARSGDTPDTLDLKATTEKLRVEITRGDQTLLFDSEDPATSTAGPLASHFASAMHRGLRLTLSLEGKVIRQEEIGDETPVSIIAGLPQFGPDELKQMVLSALSGFSSDPVAKGDRWTQKGKRSLGELGDMEFDLNYRYAEDKTEGGGKCAIVTFDGELSGDLAVARNTPAIDPHRPAALSRNLGISSQKLKGRLAFDPKARVIRSSEQIMALTVLAPDTKNPGEKIPLSMEQSLRLELLSLEPLTSDS